MVYVAKTYMGLPQIGNPYMKNKKQYIKVQLKSGKEKEVRVYSEKEFRRLYPDIEVAATERNDKKIFGFDEGYIWIFKKDPSLEDTYCRRSSARACRYWGWYFVSTEPLPQDVPSELIKLEWETVSKSSIGLKDEKELVKIIKEVRHYD